jgi:hypothetical protein
LSETLSIDARLIHFHEVAELLRLAVLEKLAKKSQELE